MQAYIHAQTYIHAWMHPYIQTYIHTYRQTDGQTDRGADMKPCPPDHEQVVTCIAETFSTFHLLWQPHLQENPPPFCPLSQRERHTNTTCGIPWSLARCTTIWYRCMLGYSDGSNPSDVNDLARLAISARICYLATDLSRLCCTLQFSTAQADTVCRECVAKPADSRANRLLPATCTSSY